MTPDMMVLLGLDSSPFRKGLRDAEGASTRSMTSIGRSMARVDRQSSQFLKSGMRFLTVGAVFGTVASSVRAYAETNSDAKARVDALSDATGRLNRSIGRDLESAINGSGGSLAGWVDSLNEARDAAASRLVKVGSFNWKDVEGTNRVKAENDASAADFANTRRMITRSRETDAAVTRERSGMFRFADREDPVRHAERAEESLRRQKAIEEIGLEKNAEVRAAARTDEDRLHAAVMARIKSQEDADRARIAAAAQLRQETERITSVRMEETRLRGEGRDAEADQLAVRAEYEEKIARVRADSTRSELDRENQIADLRDRQRQASATVAAAAKRSRDETVREFVAGRDDFSVRKLGLEGREHEAEVLKVRLDYERQIAEVMRDQTLNQAERTRGAEILAKERDEALMLTAGNSVRELTERAAERSLGSSFRAMEAGMGGSSFFRAAVGGGGGAPGAVNGETPAERRMIELESRQLETLRQMHEQLRQGVPGVLG